MDYKVILSGHLEFGSERSFEKALGMYNHKLEKAYKNDVMFDQEQAFDLTNRVFSVSRLTANIIDRTWRNTINVLKMVSDFSMAGSIGVWKLKDGKLIEHVQIEPKSEKAAVQTFIKGRELIVEGKENEAVEVLSRAIEKFSRHALAYERRGYVNYRLGNTDDALYDFSKSIDICAQSPDAFLGRALIYARRNDYKKAIADFDMVTKTSIPHQPIYWKARRLKGECHLKIDEHKEAAREYKFFTARKFSEDNPNFKWNKKAFYDYGLALLGLNQYEEAIEAFNNSIAIEEGNGQISDADQFFYRGLALKKAGKKGYEKDLSKAADCGSNQAIELLAAGV